MRNTTLIFAHILFCFVGFGQEEPVIIEAKGQRELDPAYRSAETPKVIDTILSTTLTTYPLLILQNPTSIQLEKIEPATVKIDQKLQQLYHSYIKAGIGSE